MTHAHISETRGLRGDAGVNAGDEDALNQSVSARAAARDEERPTSNSEA